jgi:arabinan endo-1,5-alpha-L-arabinosidase
MLYHAVDARRPRSKASDEVNTRRVMLLDRIVWRDGWPRMIDGRPLSLSRPRPAERN